MSLLKEMEDNASELDVSHSPFGWTKSYHVQVKGHPLAEASKVVTKDSSNKLNLKKIHLKPSKVNQQFVPIGK